MTFDDEILAAVTRGLLGSVDERGVDRAELLRRAGLSEVAIADPDAWIPIDRHVRLGQEITASLPRENLGLQTGLRIFGDPRGALGYALRKSMVHWRALENFCAYLAVVNRSMHVELSLSSPDATMTLDMVPALAALGHPAEALFAAWVGISRHLTGTRWAPAGIELTHEPRGDVAEHAAFFDCPVAFGRPRSRMVVPSRARELRIAEAPHALDEALPRACDRARELLDEDPAAARALGAVFSAVTKTPSSLRAFEPDPATSHARLALARGLLERSHSFVHEVAYLLGFADLRGFERAFEALHGVMPREMRTTTS